MYKIGVDIPAGEYKVIPECLGYLEVSSASDGRFQSIVTNDNFATEKYITVQEGQYLKLNRANIKIS